MKKIIVTLATVLILSQWSIANVQDNIAPVQMKYVKSLTEAKKIAKQIGKPIFVNCYAAWAIPCQGMDKAVFNNKAFAEWMDNHFVNLWLDVVKSEEGVAFAEKYKVVSFAQYLVLDADGEIIHKVVGGEPLPKFQETLAKALSPKTSLRGMNQIYEEGGKKSKDPQFIREYLKVIYKAGEREKYEKLLDEYLKNIPQDDWYKKENWELVSKEMNKIDEPMFLELEKNKDKFLVENPKNLIYSKLSGVYGMEFYYRAIGSIPYKSSEVTSLQERAIKAGLPADDTAFVLYKIAKLKHEKKYDELTKYLLDNSAKLDSRMTEHIDFALAQTTDFTEKNRTVVTNYIQTKSQLPECQTNAYRNALKILTSADGIEFEHTTFAEALEKAKKENKMIFLDAYTSWCGPCRILANKVFPTKEAGDYFNGRFVNYKMDMEKGEGITLAKKYGITSYPTLLLLDADGNVVHKILGAMGAKELIERIAQGENDSTSYRGVKKMYDSGNRTTDFLAKYYITMQAVNELPDAQKIIPAFLNGLSATENATPYAWRLFDKNVVNANNPLFDRLCSEFDTFCKGQEKITVEKKIAALLLVELTEPYTDEQWKRVTQSLEKINSQTGKTPQLLGSLIEYYRAKDYKAVMNVYEKRVGKLTDVTGRINLDSLLYTFLAEAPNNIKEKAKIYAESGLLLNKNEKMYQELIYAFSI